MANSEPSVFFMISKACGRCLTMPSDCRAAKRKTVTVFEEIEVVV
jgi:hypothetical protein